METNEIIDKLPNHLKNLIIDQPYDDYTAQDHAVWRYVMRQNVDYLKDVAHDSYLDGLKQTGIDINRIPNMYGMNRIMKEIGWAAVAVDGFIPPSAFMEFQAYNVLVIAADIRPIDQIEYTPAPDIIHEAAGHAPIIADKEYAKYLRNFGRIGSLALSSAGDYKMYEAIRHLSILKANPNTSDAEIQKAEQALSELAEIQDEPSEMTLLRNLHWWTVEYGLIGDFSDPKIYGAGLLSSIGESVSCLTNGVKKIRYSKQAINYSFDITKPQPQLFVTPDFKKLNSVLREFSNSMAFRTGGMEGVRKAIASENTATCVYDSGLQVSGTFGESIEKDGELIYLKTVSPTSLNFDLKEIKGHGKTYHSDGFGSPIGKLKDKELSLQFYLPDDLKRHTKDNIVTLDFESGIHVQGKLKKSEYRSRKLIVLSLTECTVTYGDQVLFDPSWGTYDMAVGDSIVSVFSGPADPVAFDWMFVPPVEKTIKINYTENQLKLHELYAAVRNKRENLESIISLAEIFEILKNDFPSDWLLMLELLELALIEKNDELASDLEAHLTQKKSLNATYDRLISKSLKLLK